MRHETGMSTVPAAGRRSRRTRQGVARCPGLGCGHGRCSGVRSGADRGGGWTTHRGDEHFFGHSGSVPGCTAFVMGNRTRGFGVVFLTDGNQAHPRLARLSNLALDLGRRTCSV